MNTRLTASILFTLHFSLCAPAASPSLPDLQIDAGFPGGNIKVHRIDGSTIFLGTDLRDTVTNEWWFYWNFRLKAPGNFPVTMVFTERNPIGARGPAMSLDGGATWQWLGAAAVRSFRHEGRPAWSFTAGVPEGRTEARFAFCPQYLESHLRTWLARHPSDMALRVEELCRSRKGRPVELLRTGCLDASKSRGVVLLTSRHHCCETMATYTMEGLLDAVLGNDETGQIWRANWEVVALPFMDKDGVEEGDQGKFRAPHDHNRDYNAQPLYPEVAAWMRLGQSLSNRVVAAIDLHCPHIRGEWNDRVYLVGGQEAGIWQGQTNFAAALQRVQQGPIRFRAQDCLPYGKAWNTGSNTRQGRSCSQWSRTAFPKARLITTVEIAYADALGCEVTAESARALGHDMSRALAELLKASK